MAIFPTQKLNTYLTSKELSWGLSVFCIMFLGLLSSQSGMDFFSGVLFLTALYWSFKYRDNEWSWPRLKMGVLWAIWVSVIACGLWLNSATNGPHLFFEFRWIIDLYIFIFFFCIFGRNTKLISIFSVILSVCSGAALLFYALGFNPIYQSWADRDTSYYWRAGGLFDHSMPLAHSYGPILLVFAGILITSGADRKKYSPWIYIALASTALTILLTFTRGVWMGVIVGLTTMTCLINRKKALTLLLAIGSVCVLIFAGSEKIRHRIMATVNFTNRGDHERITLWRANWEIFKDHPVLGIGYEQNVIHLREYYDRLGVPPGYFEAHAHNQYIHLLAGTGLLGLICYLVFIAFALYQSIIAYKTAANNEFRGIALGAIGAQICFHVGSLTESNFSIGKNRFMILFIIGWAIAIRLQTNSKTNT